jgi:hypothetical protein
MTHPLLKRLIGMHGRLHARDIAALLGDHHAH